jgi:pimeloyl-ACP methyl ester carboxylesterase
MSEPTHAPPTVFAGVLADLRRRLETFRLIEVPVSEGWSLGTDPSYLSRLMEHWRDGYDWRRIEAWVQTLPWRIAGDGDAPVRIVEQRAVSSDVAVVLVHGWPDSVLRFKKVLPLLRDVHVLIPALPGYPFAAATTRRIDSASDMADAIASAVADLGYERYVVSGGDVGTDVAESLAAAHPDRVRALHLTDLSHRHALVDPPIDLTAEERSYVEAVHRWHGSEGAYNHQQSTRPNTLAVALGDSPAGLAAWIVEKLRGWSDCGGDLESVFTRDDALDWVTAYWVTGCIGTSFAPYAHRRSPSQVTAPTAFTLFPRDIVNAPRTFAARSFDIRSWGVASGGGHFDAWERPVDYVRGIRAAIAHSPD